MINDVIKNKIKKGMPFYEPNLIHDLFSWKKLEAIINLSPFLNISRFHIISDIRYSWQKQTYDWQTDANAYPSDLIQKALFNHVCFIQDASRCDKSINQLASEIERITNHPTDAHMFFAFTTANQGFPIHNDENDNFIVQVEGETIFKVWDIVEDGNNNDLNHTKPLIDVVMKPSDVIYIPRKYWHQAISQTKRLSISFPSVFVENAMF